MEDDADKDKRLEIIMTAMIAILSISTAGTAYFSHMENSSSTHDYFTSQSILVDANSLYLEANQAIIYDFTMYDGYYLANATEDTNTSDYYYFSMSDALKDSLERDTGPFDEQYYDEMYENAESVYEDGTLLAFDAAEQNTASDEYQLAVLISAVGLSLTGWAALMKTKRLKVTFLTCSIFCLIMTSIQTLSV